MTTMFLAGLSFWWNGFDQKDTKMKQLMNETVSISKPFPKGAKSDKNPSALNSQIIPNFI